MSGQLVPRPTTAIERFVSSRERSIARRQTEVAACYETGEALMRDLRIKNGFQLADHACERLSRLDRTIFELSHDNPGLEMDMRALQRSVLRGVAGIIGDYMDR